jgi:hypothetical protein
MRRRKLEQPFTTPLKICLEMNTAEMKKLEQIRAIAMMME